MAKPVRMLNKYHIKEMLLHGNPQYENFYKEELIQFCKIAQQQLDQYKNNWEDLKKWIKEETERLMKIEQTNNVIFLIGAYDEVLNKMKELEGDK